MVTWLKDAAMAETAWRWPRNNWRPREGNWEWEYTFRAWLLRLGYIGNAYSAGQKIFPDKPEGDKGGILGGSLLPYLIQ